MKIHQRILANLILVLLGATTMATVRGATVVFDPSNFTQAVQQVAQLTQQLNLLQQQYQQLLQTYQAIAHVPQASLNEFGQQMRVDQFRNALPAQSSVVGGVMNGTTTGQGTLAPTAQAFAGQNHIYTATANDFQAGELQRTANSVAGTQAVASELYQSATNRVRALQDIEDLLATAPDTKAVADLHARIATEQTYIQAQQVQAQSLTIWQASQQRNQEQRSQEERRRQVDTLIDDARAHGG